MPKTRPPYPPQFRARLIELARTGRTPEELGRLGDTFARRAPSAHFLISGVTLAASLLFTVPAVLSPSPAVFWPAMFLTLLMLFVNIGPLNAAMANVLPADLRARGFAVTTMIMHLLGDAASPWLIGVASDSVGLRVPVLVTGAMLALAGVVLLAGRRTLERDMRALALPGPRLTLRSDSPGRSTVWSRRAVGPARR